MIKYLILFVAALVSEVSFCQSDFNDCRDELLKGLISKNYINPDIFIDWEKCLKGKAFPTLSLETIDGSIIKTDSLKGKVIVVNLWFINCYPCIAELPALNKLVKEFQEKDVVFLAISLDSKERLESDFIPKHKFDFTVIPASQKHVDILGRTGFPTTYIIDKNGNVHTVWAGGEIGKFADTEAYTKAKPIIKKLLKAE